ncbi:MAG TPA: hypothetical protein VK964_09235 [Nocardioidaceae bacterium]|jgi:hypothetical protein|nr:hypothetical protein [Nocardioidaceae bacterium]
MSRYVLRAEDSGEKESMMKKPLIIILVLFLGFYLLRDPAELAVFSSNAAVALWNMISTLFVAIIEFLNALLGR